jgi:RNA polymerase sigma-70 factor (ECF subfamily)
VDANEARIIERAQRGDREAFAILVEAHALFVYNLAYRLVADAQEAENLAQEAFLRAWRAIPGFRRQAKFSTWLYQIVTNLCYSRLPGLKQELEAMDTEQAALHLADERQAVEAGLLSDELRTYLHQAIGALPEGHRLLISLRYLKEMSYEEIVQVTGMPLGTVKTGLFRAKEKLRAALEAYEGNQEDE